MSYVRFSTFVSCCCDRCLHLISHLVALVPKSHHVTLVPKSHLVALVPKSHLVALVTKSLPVVYVDVYEVSFH